MDVEVSVIIVSYNSGTLLLECVQSVLCSSLVVEVIVSDNGSVDCSIEALENLARREPRLVVCRNSSNLGFSKGNNVVLPRARGAYVLFLNPDCFVAPDTLARMVAAMQAHPKAGMAGCLIRNPDGSEQAGCRRKIPTPRHAFAKLMSFVPRRRPRLDVFLANAEPMPTAPAPVEAISGAFMLVRRAVIDKLGSFDEMYFMHWEDLDLCLRTRLAGWDVLFVPSVEVVHFKGRSSSQRPVFVEWHKHVGLFKFFRKFYYQSSPVLLHVALGLAIVGHFLTRIVKMRLRTIVPRQLARPPEFACACSKEIWVFGATSQVGRFLLPRLVANGYCVRAFSRAPVAARAQDSMRLIWQAYDFGGPLCLPGIGRPDIVIHLAPLRLLPGQIDALAKKGMRHLIAFGSTSRFTKRDSSNPKERDLVADLERAEREIEAKCGGLGVRWAIFRPTLIYSLGHDHNLSVLSRFIRRFGFFPLPGNGSGLRQPVHADDLAQACVSLIDASQGWNQAYNLSGSQVMSYRAMVDKIFHKLGLRSRFVSLSRSWWVFLLFVARLLPAYREINMDMINRVNTDMCFAHDEAARNFGFSPRGLVL
jgi:GT2 family glycosyltransferase/nucleoside-diphosphate-sugar epimerase